MIATKLAAADPANVRGKKAVVFLSPGWFVAPELDRPGFGVNFSPLHGGVFTFESRLSPALKQDLARRLLDYPDIMAKYPLLKAGLTCLAANTGSQRALLAAIAPLAPSTTACSANWITRAWAVVVARGHPCHARA